MQVQTIAPYSSSSQATVFPLSEDTVYASDPEGDAIRHILSYSEVVPGDSHLVRGMLVLVIVLSTVGVVVLVSVVLCICLCCRKHA